MSSLSLFVETDIIQQKKKVIIMFLQVYPPNSERPVGPARSCPTKLTFNYNQDSSRRLEKQAATAKLETAATCRTRAGLNFSPRPETAFGSSCRALLVLYPPQCESLLRGSEALICFSPAPLYLSASLLAFPESFLFLPFSTLIVFLPDKDLITGGEDLEPEPHL